MKKFSLKWIAAMLTLSVMTSILASCNFFDDDEPKTENSIEEISDTVTENDLETEAGTDVKTDADTEPSTTPSTEKNWVITPEKNDAPVAGGVLQESVNSDTSWGQIQQGISADDALIINFNAQYHTIFEKLTINAIGDSYFEGHTLGAENVWLQLFANKYGSTLNNHGLNGSTVSNYITTRRPMCDRYTQMPSGADIILVEGGRNDWGYHVPIGTVNSYDTTTFIGALNTIVKGLKEKNPDAMIVLLTNWKYNGTNQLGLTYADYANATLAVAESQGVYSINASDPSVVGVDMTNVGFKMRYSISATDESHLNAKGMMYVMPKFESILARYYAEFLINNA